MALEAVVSDPADSWPAPQNYAREGQRQEVRSRSVNAPLLGYKRSYKSPDIGYNYSYPAYNPTYNYNYP